MSTQPASDLARRKSVRLRLRPDLSITPQKYEGRTFYVVKDPIALRYYRFKEQEHFLLQFMDGSQTLEDAQKAYEEHFRPERLTLEDLEGFAQQLLMAGLAQNESPQAGKQLLDRKNKRKKSQLARSLTNILYIKIPIFDPERLLQRLLKYTAFFFSLWFFFLSVCLMLGAMLLVSLHFETFLKKLPSYHEFFSFKTVIYLWVALGVVKVIHEFGHGLSCKKFGGEVHEMGFLFLVFSPCLYCNVSDSWTLPSKWKRIVISAAGIYVELVIAAIATFVWWNTPTQPFINNLALSLMVVCSISTIVFNANPLMRFDGYYVLADWIEIPNLREKANRYLKNIFCKVALGIEVPPEPYMARWRRVLFVVFAIASYIYRWVITYFILWFIYNFLKPYKLGVISAMLAFAALASMIGWPLYNLIKNIHKRGRLPDMKPIRVFITCTMVVGLILFVGFVPLPVSRVHCEGMVVVHPDEIQTVNVDLASANNRDLILKRLMVKDGERVSKGQELAEVVSLEMERRIEKLRSQFQTSRALELQLRNAKSQVPDATPEVRRNFDERIEQAQADWKQALSQLQVVESERNRNRIIRAPRAGIVMNLPMPEELGRLWDKSRPLCRVGDPSKMRVVMPVTAGDYAILKDNLDRAGVENLAVDIRVKGLGTTVWKGQLTYLPQTDAQRIPMALSNRAGGPVPVKPAASADPQSGELVPQTQHYLVQIDLLKPDSRVHPGTLARVKVHCRKRTIAWWLWRSINDTFNLGLM